MYFHLFNAITDALRALGEQQAGQAAMLLQKAQAETEEMYIGAEQ